MDLSPPAILHAARGGVLRADHQQRAARLRGWRWAPTWASPSISGHFAFDALVVFAPHFMFMIDLGIGLTVRALGVTLCGVSIQLHLEGPAPWRAEGTPRSRSSGGRSTIDVGPFTWGDDDNPPPAPADPRQLVHDALHHNPGAWQALMPPDADRVVQLLPRHAERHRGDRPPHGPVRRAPARRAAGDRDRPGRRQPGARRPAARPLRPARWSTATPAGALSEVTDLFSAGNFLDLTDDQKLSRPSFEPMPAGRADPAARREGRPSPPPRQAELRYETFVCDDDALLGMRQRAGVDSCSLASAAAGARRRGRRAQRSCARVAATPPSPTRSCSPTPARASSGSKVDAGGRRGGRP